MGVQGCNVRVYCSQHRGNVLSRLSLELGFDSHDLQPFVWRRTFTGRTFRQKFLRWQSTFFIQVNVQYLEPDLRRISKNAWTCWQTKAITGSLLVSYDVVIKHTNFPPQLQFRKYRIYAWSRVISMDEGVWLCTSFYLQKGMKNTKKV